MRNVKRAEEPRTLKRNSKKWTKELLQAIASRDAARIKRAQKKYNKEEVKNALKKMYKGLCCYCEGNIREVSFGHIEHRKPIEHYPEEGYNWNNLHLACERCNNHKSDQYNNEYPILDPTGNEPVKNHLSFRLSAEKAGIEVTPNTNRGATTIDHADLNRNSLCEGRRELYNWAFEVIEKLDESENAPINNSIRAELNKLKLGRYGSIIERMLRV